MQQCRICVPMCESRSSIYFSCKSACNFLCSAWSLFVAEIRNWDDSIEEESNTQHGWCSTRSVTTIMVNMLKCSIYKISVERRGFLYINCCLCSIFITVIILTFSICFICYNILKIPHQKKCMKKHICCKLGHSNYIKD